MVQGLVLVAVAILVAMRLRRGLIRGEFGFVPFGRFWSLYKDDAPMVSATRGYSMLIRGVPRVVIALVFWVLFSESANALDGYAVDRVGGQLVLIGEINLSMRNQFFASLAPSIKEIVVRSGGGDTLAALDIAKEIHRRKLSLVVRGACFSGCAELLFMAAARRTVEPDSLVVFHNSSSSSLQMLGPNGDRVLHAFLVPRSQGELAFYRELGLPISLLYQPQIEIRTQCYGDRRGGDALAMGYHSEFGGWVPWRGYLEGLGIQISGFWPATQSELTAATRKQIAPGAHFPIVLGGRLTPTPMAELLNDYKHIVPCA